MSNQFQGSFLNVQEAVVTKQAELSNTPSVKYKKSLFTMAAIFGAAFLLAAVGCGNSSSSPSAPSDGRGQQQSGEQLPEDRQDLVALQPDSVRECSNNEFAQLVSWRNSLDKANSLIDQLGASSQNWKKSQTVIDAATLATNNCDSRFYYHEQQPCKKTKVTVVKTEVKVYDAFRIRRDCSKPVSYLKKFNLRPQPQLSQPLPLDPTPADPQPVNPQPIPPPNNDGQNPQPLPPPVDQGQVNSNVKVCSTDEFSKLTIWSQALDRTTKALAKMGSMPNWKFDSLAIEAATEATQLGEELIKYHTNQPCQKNIKQADGSMINKLYNQQTVSERSMNARLYFYNFVQRVTSLNSKNAQLFLDLSNFSKQRFEAQSFTQIDQCVVENRTDSIIDYTGRKALVKDSRGFDVKMAVLETEEGLLVQCYGLELDGPFSKVQVVNLLKAKGTQIKLEYQLK